MGVTIDRSRIRLAAEEIRRRCNVALLAVVKANAYGLGAAEIAETIGDVVDGFCVFSLTEAIDARLWEITGKPILALRSEPTARAEDFLAAHVRPAVWDIDQARRLRSARPILSVDTGMQRFNCPADQIEAVLSAGDCDEAFTHAIHVDQVKQLTDILGCRGLRLHAAGSSLLNEPAAWLDAVRPGIALYRGAVRVSTPLVEVRDSHKPAGYSGFTVPRFGVILRGYSHGLRIGPCIINGLRRRILETGMQSAFVEIGSAGRIGDEVVLLGDGLTEADIARDWGTTEHEVLVRLSQG